MTSTMAGTEPDRRGFVTVDVFTDRRFEANPVAVILDARADDGAMQCIAREFNYVETTFVLPPHDPVHTAHVRIFTPVRECPSRAIPTSARRSRWLVERRSTDRGHLDE
jgi:trans-2,3-dihydro-3-hydroxyanthranilate isomerase